MSITRRGFITSGAVALAFLGLRRRVEGFPGGLTLQASPGSAGYGPLQADPARTLDLPQGFRYQILSRTGERMDDGFQAPGGHDGMAAFQGPGGRTILVRNHELAASAVAQGPFGANNALFSKLTANQIYDAAPALGGTTTLIYDTRNGRLERQYLSLVGTVRNCAGGPTPWNSWVTCEEATDRAGRTYRQDHGYNFEVPAASQGLVAPVPLKAMGRFNHEAIAVDAATGIVYETEDRGDSLFYRFIPTVPGNLRGGGRLQALRIVDMPAADTSNATAETIPLERALDVDWVDLENVESPGDDLRKQGLAKGAARFARGEGVVAAGGSVFFVATSGGRAKVGQIFRYTPATSKLSLFIESPDTTTLDMGDNIAVAPFGDMIVCEDGPQPNHVVGVTPKGEIYKLARNAMSDSEFCGAVFSPDGSTLFLNIQRPGLTFAITGPWSTVRQDRP